jgi:hypothetical protein
MITPSSVWSDEFVEGAFIQLSGGTATNHFNHSQSLHRPLEL